jgi:hypothetical protein
VELAIKGLIIDPVKAAIDEQKVAFWVTRQV